MRIYLIRHTKLKVQNNICYGNSEVELADSFLEEASLIKTKIFNLKDFVVYSSPLQRCVKLANFLFPNQFQIKTELQEMNFGTWTNKTWDYIPELWYQDFVNYKIPEGESFIDFYNKIISFFQIEVTNCQRDMIWITHAGVIRSIVCFVLHLDLQNAFYFSLDYGGITTILKKENMFYLEKLNC